MCPAGIGFSDVENRVAIGPENVFRIASISKSITMTIVAKLWESDKLDLDAPVQKYVPDFPEKLVNGEKVSYTCTCSNSENCWWGKGELYMYVF